MTPIYSPCSRKDCPQSADSNVQVHHHTTTLAGRSGVQRSLVLDPQRPATTTAITSDRTNSDRTTNAKNLSRGRHETSGFAHDLHAHDEPSNAVGTPWREDVMRRPYLHTTIYMMHALNRRTLNAADRRRHTAEGGRHETSELAHRWTLNAVETPRREYIVHHSGTQTRNDNSLPYSTCCKCFRSRLTPSSRSVDSSHNAVVCYCSLSLLLLL